MVQSALEYTLSVERYEEKGFKKTMVEDLNTWARSLPETDDWAPDPLLKKLPEKLQKIPAVTNLDKLYFFTSDADFLQQAIWAKAVADRVILADEKGIYQYLLGAATDGLEKDRIVELHGSQYPLHDSLAVLYPELNPEQIDNLARTCKLFDWIVRNIQLDEMPVEYRGEAAIQKAKDYVDVPTGDPAADGVEGPGYTKSPGQVLLTGKGDAWQRNRLFILLCRQLGIDAVMVNVYDRNETGKVVPWVVGALIADRLFLFDPIMGLPFPSPDYRRIATLKDVLAHRDFLTQLRYKLSESTDADSDYRIRPEQLDRIVVWLDASAESLSRRMALLEPNLTGDYRAKITFSPSKLQQELAEWKFSRIELSPIPFQNSQYAIAFEKSVQRRKANAMRMNYMLYEYFNFHIPIKKVVRKERIDEATQSIRSGEKIETATIDQYLLSEARHRFLLGVFEPDMKSGRDTLGARKLRTDLELGRETEDAAQLFVNLTLDDSRIDEILSDDDWLIMLGLSAQSENQLSDQEQADLLVIIESCMKLIRTDASIWLALTNFETGDFGNAQNWLNQISRFDTNRKWADLTNYNLARTHEALLNYTEAIKLYRQNRSQQKFGNIIRARLIQRWNLGDPTATQPD